LSSFDPLRYRTARALVIALRVAIDNSIRPGQPRNPGNQRSDALSRGPFSVRQRTRYADHLDESTRLLDLRIDIAELFTAL
jgi:hypothetical protein